MATLTTNSLDFVLNKNKKLLIAASITPNHHKDFSQKPPDNQHSN